MANNNEGCCAILAADLHLDEHAWSGRKEVRGDSIHAFSQIVDLAIQYQAPIIAAGDLVDRKPNRTRVVETLRTEIGRLSDAGLRFYFIQGQHDYSEPPWPVAADSRAVHMDGQTIAIDNGSELVRFYGIDWTPPSRLQQRLEEVPLETTDWLVMHQVCDVFMGDITRPELRLSDVPDVPNLLVGDYHCRKRVGAKYISEEYGSDKKHKRDEPLMVVSPGATNIRAINEPPNSFVYALRSHTTNSVSPILLQSRPVVSVTQAYSDSIDDTIEQLAVERSRAREAALEVGCPEHIAEPLLRFAYRGDEIGVRDKLQASLGDSSLPFLFLSFVDGEEPDKVDAVSADFAARLGDAATAKDRVKLSLPKFLSKKDQPDAYAIAEDLLSCSDPSHALAQLRKDYGVDDPDTAVREFAEKKTFESLADFAN